VDEMALVMVVGLRVVTITSEWKGNFFVPCGVRDRNGAGVKTADVERCLTIQGENGVNAELQLLSVGCDRIRVRWWEFQRCCGSVEIAGTVLLRTVFDLGTRLRSEAMAEPMAVFVIWHSIVFIIVVHFRITVNTRDIGFLDDIFRATPL